MATLTNPITAQNIVDRYADFVTASANENIIWGTNALPFSEMPTANFGGTTAGKTITKTGTDIVGTDSLIAAAKIYDTLLAETRTYTRIRRLRAILFVDGPGGNTGTRANPGVIFDQTQKSNLNNNYLQDLGFTSNANVTAGQLISSANLETLFTNMRISYSTAATTTATIQVNVCHASCHSSCHGSRGRR
jgi:hypothetical protein